MFVLLRRSLASETNLTKNIVDLPSISWIYQVYRGSSRSNGLPGGKILFPPRFMCVVVLGQKRGARFRYIKAKHLEANSPVPLLFSHLSSMFPFEINPQSFDCRNTSHSRVNFNPLSYVD